MKNKVGKLIHEYVVKNSGHEEKMLAFANFFDNFFENVEEEYSDIKDAFYEEVEDFTHEIDEAMVVAIVDNLRKKDGSYSGAKWSMEETESVAKQYDVKGKVEALGKHYENLKFWLAMNYVYAVHCNVNRTVNGYVDLAVDEMLNKNFCFDDLIRRIFKKM